MCKWMRERERGRRRRGFIGVGCWWWERRLCLQLQLGTALPVVATAVGSVHFADIEKANPAASMAVVLRRHSRRGELDC